MPKALVTADLHVHAHKDRVDRLSNCLDVLDWIFQTAAQQGVEYIFFLGDLFHERSKIDVLNYLRTFECFMRHLIDDAKGIEVYLLVGNHDMYHKQRWDVNSVKPLTAIPNVHIVDEPCTLEIGGRKIDWLPHVENPIEDLKKLSKGKKGGLLLSHLALSDAQTNTLFGTRADVIVEYDNDMVKVDSKLFDSWDLTLLGHYHGTQRLCDGKVEYVGSPLQLNFGEAFQDKHLLILDLETLERGYVINDFSPKHFIVNEQDIEDENYDLDGHFVRCIINDMGAKDILDLKKKVRQEHNVLSFDFKSKDKKPEENEAEETVIEDAKGILLKEEEMLERWIEECKRAEKIPEGLDLDHLLEVGKRSVVEEDE